jgi:hypothetical protein
MPHPNNFFSRLGTAQPGLKRMISEEEQEQLDRVLSWKPPWEPPWEPQEFAIAQPDITRMISKEEQEQLDKKNEIDALITAEEQRAQADIMHQYETDARTQNIERFTGAIKQVPSSLARGTGQFIAGIGGGIQRTAVGARAPELWAEAEEAEPVEMGSPRYFAKQRDIALSKDPLPLLARIIGKDRVASFGDWNVKVGESIQKSYPPTEIAKRPATDPKTFLNPEALLHPQWWAENTTEMLPMVTGLIGAVLVTRGLTTRLGAPQISQIALKRMAESGSAATKKFAADIVANPELMAGWERVIEVFVPAWFNAQLEAGFAFVEAKGAGQDDLLASQNAHKVFTHNLPWTAMFSTGPLAALRKYPGAFTRMLTALGEPIQEVGEEIISSWFVHGEMPSTEHMVKTFVTMAPIGAASAAVGERQPFDRATEKAEGDILEVGIPLLPAHLPVDEDIIEIPDEDIISISDEVSYGIPEEMEYETTASLLDRADELDDLLQEGPNQATVDEIDRLRDIIREELDSRGVPQSERRVYDATDLAEGSIPQLGGIGERSEEPPFFEADDLSRMTDDELDDISSRFEKYQEDLFDNMLTQDPDFMSRGDVDPAEHPLFSASLRQRINTLYQQQVMIDSEIETRAQATQATQAEDPPSPASDYSEAIMGPDGIRGLTDEQLQQRVRDIGDSFRSSVENLPSGSLQQRAAAQQIQQDFIEVTTEIERRIREELEQLGFPPGEGGQGFLSSIGREGAQDLPDEQQGALEAHIEAQTNNDAFLSRQTPEWLQARVTELENEIESLANEFFLDSNEDPASRGGTFTRIQVLQAEREEIGRHIVSRGEDIIEIPDDDISGRPSGGDIIADRHDMDLQSRSPEQLAEQYEALGANANDIEEQMDQLTARGEPVPQELEIAFTSITERYELVDAEIVRRRNLGEGRPHTSDPTEVVFEDGQGLRRRLSEIEQILLNPTSRRTIHDPEAATDTEISNINQLNDEFNAIHREIGREVLDDLEGANEINLRERLDEIQMLFFDDDGFAPEIRGITEELERRLSVSDPTARGTSLGEGDSIQQMRDLQDENLLADIQELEQELEDTDNAIELELFEDLADQLSGLMGEAQRRLDAEEVDPDIFAHQIAEGDLTYSGRGSGTLSLDETAEIAGTDTHILRQEVHNISSDTPRHRAIIDELELRGVEEVPAEMMPNFVLGLVRTMQENFNLSTDEAMEAYETAGRTLEERGITPPTEAELRRSLGPESERGAAGDLSTFTMFESRGVSDPPGAVTPSFRAPDAFASLSGNELTLAFYNSVDPEDVGITREITNRGWVVTETPEGDIYISPSEHFNDTLVDMQNTDLLELFDANAGDFEIDPSANNEQYYREILRELGRRDSRGEINLEDQPALQATVRASLPPRAASLPPLRQHEGLSEEELNTNISNLEEQQRSSIEDVDEWTELEDQRGVFLRERAARLGLEIDDFQEIDDTIETDDTFVSVIPGLSSVEMEREFIETPEGQAWVKKMQDQIDEMTEYMDQETDQRERTKWQDAISDRNAILNLMDPPATNYPSAPHHSASMPPYPSLEIERNRQMTYDSIERNHQRIHDAEMVFIRKEIVADGLMAQIKLLKAKEEPVPQELEDKAIALQREIQELGFELTDMQDYARRHRLDVVRLEGDPGVGQRLPTEDESAADIRLQRGTDPLRGQNDDADLIWQAERIREAIAEDPDEEYTYGVMPGESLAEDRRAYLAAIEQEQRRRAREATVARTEAITPPPTPPTPPTPPAGTQPETLTPEANLANIIRENLATQDVEAFEGVSDADLRNSIMGLRQRVGGVDSRELARMEDELRRRAGEQSTLPEITPDPDAFGDHNVTQENIYYLWRGARTDADREELFTNLSDEHLNLLPYPPGLEPGDILIPQQFPTSADDDRYDVEANMMEGMFDEMRNRIARGADPRRFADWIDHWDDFDMNAAIEVFEARAEEQRSALAARAEPGADMSPDELRESIQGMISDWEEDPSLGMSPDIPYDDEFLLRLNNAINEAHRRDIRELPELPEDLETALQDVATESGTPDIRRTEFPSEESGPRMMTREEAEDRLREWGIEPGDNPMSQFGEEARARGIGRQVPLSSVFGDVRQARESELQGLREELQELLQTRVNERSTGATNLISLDRMRDLRERIEDLEHELSTGEFRDRADNTRNEFLAGLQGTLPEITPMPTFHDLTGMSIDDLVREVDDASLGIEEVLRQGQNQSQIGAYLRHLLDIQSFARRQGLLREGDDMSAIFLISDEIEEMLEQERRRLPDQEEMVNRLREEPGALADIDINQPDGIIPNDILADEVEVMKEAVDQTGLYPDLDEMFNDQNIMASLNRLSHQTGMEEGYLAQRLHRLAIETIEGFGVQLDRGAFNDIIENIRRTGVATGVIRETGETGAQQLDPEEIEEIQSSTTVDLQTRQAQLNDMINEERNENSGEVISHHLANEFLAIHDELTRRSDAADLQGQPSGGGDLNERFSLVRVQSLSDNDLVYEIENRRDMLLDDGEYFYLLEEEAYNRELDILSEADVIRIEAEHERRGREGN